MLDLYYYTRVETMKYILTDANIYATNLGYMNDSEEYANGLKELRNIFNEKTKHELISEERLKKELAEDITTYSISFSAARDLLSQWSMYAGESGVSLKMNFDVENKYRVYSGKGKERISLNSNHIKINPQEIYYCTKDAMDSKEYERVTNKIWEKMTETQSEVERKDIEGNYLTLWKTMTPYVKRVEFSAEKEYRLVFEQSLWHDEGVPFRIDYRNSRNVLKPYIDVQCEGGWPIKEIIVGPGFNQEVVYNSILHFLNNVPLQVKKVSGVMFAERCEEYWELCGGLPESAEKIWKENSDEFQKDNIDEYKIFVNIRNKMIEELQDEKFGEELRKRTITKSGIILSKSRIPYIYEN